MIVKSEKVIKIINFEGSRSISQDRTNHNLNYLKAKKEKFKNDIFKKDYNSSNNTNNLTRLRTPSENRTKTPIKFNPTNTNIRRIDKSEEKKTFHLIEQKNIEKLIKKRAEIPKKSKTLSDKAIIEKEEKSQPKQNFPKVESKIKSVIARDRKIYNLLKNNENFQQPVDVSHDNSSIIQKNEASNKKVITSKINNATVSPSKNQTKYIGDNVYSSEKQNQSNNSFEERINGIRKRISDIESMNNNFNATIKK